MADQVFTVAKGRAGELYRRAQANTDPNAGLVVLLLEAAVADDTLRDFQTLSALLADAGNTESQATGYARLVLDDTDLTLPVQDDVNHRVDYDIPDQTFPGLAGGNITVKAVVCYDPDITAGDDTTIIPITHQDFAVTPDAPITVQIDPAGFYRAG